MLAVCLGRGSGYLQRWCGDIICCKLRWYKQVNTRNTLGNPHLSRQVVYPMWAECPMLTRMIVVGLATLSNMQ